MSIFFNLRLMKKFLFLIIILIFSNHSFADEELINLINEKLIEIGEFKEPREYPEGFLKTTAKKCKDLKFICIQDKAVKEMSLRFKRTDKYNDKNPGNQVYAMAHFELFFMNKLRKDRNSLKKFKENWPEKKINADKIVSLIKLNETRKMMRNALGLNMNNSIEEVIDTYWTLGDFLQLGETKVEKVDKDLLKRKRILSEYKSMVSSLKRNLETQDLQRAYEFLEKK